MSGGELTGEQEDARKARGNINQFDDFLFCPNVSKEVRNI